MNSFIIVASINANANRNVNRNVGRKAQAERNLVECAAWAAAQDADDRAERARGGTPRPIFWASCAALAAERAGLVQEAQVLWDRADEILADEDSALWDAWDREPLSSSAQARLEARDRARANASSRFRAKRGVHYLRCP